MSLSFLNEKSFFTSEIQFDNGLILVNNFGQKGVPSEKKKDKDDDKGNFTLVTNNKIRFEAGETVELFSPKKVEVVCNNVLKLMGDKEVDFIAGICNMISYDDRRGAPSECKGFGNDDQSVGGIS